MSTTADRHGDHAQRAAAFFSGAFAERPVMAIFRGSSPAETVRKARAAWAAGVALVEVPVSSPDGWEAVTAVLDAAEGRPVGVGTVLSTEQVDRAAACRAAFTVAPGFDPDVSRRCAEQGLPHLPGVATPSDVARAMASGHVWQKAFPASVLGPEWVRAMAGPFPDVAFVCTGGMTLERWEPFRAAGARAVAIGAGFASGG